MITLPLWVIAVLYSRNCLAFTTGHGNTLPLESWPMNWFLPVVYFNRLWQLRKTESHPVWWSHLPEQMDWTTGLQLTSCPSCPLSVSQRGRKRSDGDTPKTHECFEKLWILSLNQYYFNFWIESPGVLLIWRRKWKQSSAQRPPPTELSRCACPQEVLTEGNDNRLTLGRLIQESLFVIVQLEKH